MLVPHVVEKEIVRDDGSVVKRLDSSMALCRNDHWCLLKGLTAAVNKEAWRGCTLSSNHCYSPNFHLICTLQCKWQ